LESWLWQLDGDQEFVKKWFVLRDNTLFVFDQKDGNQLAEVNLEDCSPEIVPESKYHRKCCFELTAPLDNVVLIISAENSANLQEWTLSLRRSMLRLRRIKTKAAQAARRQQERSDSNLTTSALGRSDTISSISMDSTYRSGEYASVIGAATEDDKYSVYRKWLEECKTDPDDHSGRTMNQSLLGAGADSSDSSNPQRRSGCACCGRCTVM
jgi:hypothetical protein